MKRRGYTPEKTLARRERAKREGLCVNCYVNPRADGKTRCAKCLATATRRWERIKADPVKRKENARKAGEWRRANPEHRRETLRQYRKKLRRRVLEHYGVRCSCPGCNVTEEKWLAVDHIDGGGNEHRKKIGLGSTIYAWLIRNNFPDGFRLLCHNCNLSRAFYGKCPHEE